MTIGNERSAIARRSLRAIAHRRPADNTLPRWRQRNDAFRVIKPLEIRFGMTETCNSQTLVIAPLFFEARIDESRRRASERS